MSGGWVKHFADHSMELGFDREVARGVSSWSKGRLAGITAVSLIEEGFEVTLFGLGDWWQSDDMEVAFPNPTAEVVCRRVQKKLDNNDVIYLVEPARIQIIKASALTSMEVNSYGVIRPDMIGKWFTVELYPNGIIKIPILGERLG